MSQRIVDLFFAYSLTVELILMLSRLKNRNFILLAILLEMSFI